MSIGKGRLAVVTWGKAVRAGRNAAAERAVNVGSEGIGDAWWRAKYTSHNCLSERWSPNVSGGARGVGRWGGYVG